MKRYSLGFPTLYRLPCHILFPLLNHLSSLALLFPFATIDLFLLLIPLDQPWLTRDVSTTSPLMKFLYYFNKRYSPVSDRYSSPTHCASPASAPVTRDSTGRPRLCAIHLCHFCENVPAYVSSRRILHVVNFADQHRLVLRGREIRAKRYSVSVSIYLTGIDDPFSFSPSNGTNATTFNRDYQAL